MNNMKEVKIIQSKTEPNKNHLWLSDEGLKQFKGDGWEQVLSNDNGGSGGGSNIKYYDVSNVSSENSVYVEILVGFIALLVKTNSNNICTSYGIIQHGSMSDSFAAIAVDLETIIMLNGVLMSIEDYFKLLSNGELNLYDFLMNLPELTKEQFYNLNE